MKYLFLILLTASFVSCTSTPEQDTPEPTKESESTTEGTPEEIMLRQIKSELKINAVEKFDYKVYNAELTQDDSTDWIISVNLLDRALNEAVKSNRVKQMETVGYMGHYNYIFFMDGATKEISQGVVIPSSAYAELIIGFENITSSTKKDFTIDLKIRNSRRRRFYTISDGKPLQICEEVVFYNYGKDGETPDAHVIEYEEVEGTNIRNILVYKGSLEQTSFEKPTDVYDADPEITSTGDIVRRWYYSSQLGKYYLKPGEL